VSLRGRLLLGTLLLNVVVAAVLLAASFVWHGQRAAEQRATYERILRILLADAYSPTDEVNAPWVRRLLSMEGLHRRGCRDVFVTTRYGRGSAFVELNPLGAAGRPADFPLPEIREGIREAMHRGVTIEVAGGICVPVLSDDIPIVGAWYLLDVPPAQLQVAWLLLAVFAVASLFGLFAYFSIGRLVLQPLSAIGRVARRVGGGDYGARVEGLGVAELEPLADSFNAMARRVEGHTRELAEAVRLATEEAQRKERALTQSSRLAAIGTLAAGIAHEINNPIGGMLNAVQKLLQSQSLTERERVYLQLVQDGLERIGRIARRVLDFTPRTLEIRPFPLAIAIEGVRALVEHRLKRSGVDLQASLPADLPPVLGEPHEIQQVLLNLLLNSLDALESHPPPRRIQITAGRSGPNVEIVVADNGPGIDSELLGRVLDPFFSTKNQPGSSGLGMFISYSIIKNHGGEMELGSAPGQGFRVRIRLPAAA
jgi:signal transduction histidine kinase